MIGDVDLAAADPWWTAIAVLIVVLGVLIITQDEA